MSTPIKINAPVTIDGQVSATSFAGSGSPLTGITATQVGLGNVLNAKQVTAVSFTTPTSIFASPVNFTVDGAGSATAALTLTSQAANTFLAAPNGSAGVPSARTIVAADLPGTLNATTFTTSVTTGIEYLQHGDNSTGSNNFFQVQFGSNGGNTFPHWITTWHNSGLATGNAIKFYTSDGTSAGVFPTNAILGLTITNGTITVPGSITGGSFASTGFSVDSTGRLSTTQSTAASVSSVLFAPTFTGASVAQVGLAIQPTWNQSGTASATDLFINATETTLGSGGHSLINAGVGGVTLFLLSNAGTVSFNNKTAGTQTAINIQDGGTTKWQYGKQTDNTFFFYDAANARNIIQTTTAGTLQLMPSGGNIVLTLGTFAKASGTDLPVAIQPTYNQTSTASATDLYVNRTETAIGSGTQNLLDLQRGGVSQFHVDRIGNVTAVGNSVTTGTVTGSNGLFVTGVSYTVQLAASDAEHGWQTQDSTATYKWYFSQRPSTDGSNPRGMLLYSYDGTTFRNFWGCAYDGTMKLYAPAGTAVRPGTMASASGTDIPFQIVTTYNQTSTAGATDLLINRTETAVGSGQQAFFDGQVAGVSKCQILRSGTFQTPKLNPVAGTNLVINDGSYGTATNVVNLVTGTMTNSAGTLNAVLISPTYNQTGTSSTTDLYVNRTETALGSGNHYLIRAAIVGSNIFVVEHTGQVWISNKTAGTQSSILFQDAGTYKWQIGKQSDNTFFLWDPTNSRNVIQTDSNGNLFLMNGGTSGGVSGRTRISHTTFNAASGSDTAASVEPIYNQTGTSTGTDFLINRTNTAVGSGQQLFINCAISGVSAFFVDTAGNIFNPAIQISSGGTINRSATNQTLNLASTAFTVSGTAVQAVRGTYSNASGTMVGLSLTPTYNQTSTAAATDFLINRTQTAVGSGNQRFLDCQVSGVSKFYVDNSGNLYGASLTNPNGVLYLGNVSTASSSVVVVTPTLTAASAPQDAFDITPTYNQTGSASANDLNIVRTGTWGTGAQNFINCATTSGGSKFSLDITGNITAAGAKPSIPNIMIGGTVVSLTGAKFLSGYTTGMAASTDTVCYTCPTGKRALVIGRVYINNNAGAATMQTKIGIGATTYLASTPVSVATVAVSANSAEPGIILEAAETLVVNSTQTSGTVFYRILEFDNTNGLKSAKLTALIAGDNTLYTVTSGKTAAVLDTNGQYSSAPQSSIAFAQNSGGSINWHVNLVPFGLSPAAANQVTNVLSAATATKNVANLPANMNSGDFLNINSNTAVSGGTALAWVNVVEV